MKILKLKFVMNGIYLVIDNGVELALTMKAQLKTYHKKKVIYTVMFGPL
jgi:hypothetical protein